MMTYPCEIKQQAAQPTLYVRRRTPVQNLPQVLGQVYGDITQHLTQLNEKPAGPPFVAYHNMNMQNLDCEIGFPVAKALPGKGDIQPGELPSGTVAVCLYTGPYAEIGPAYEELNRWIASHHFRVLGIAYEMYLNDPQQTPPNKLQTRIVFPVEAA
jgi:effector-binding domain-containing protein